MKRDHGGGFKQLSISDKLLFSDQNSFFWKKTISSKQKDHILLSKEIYIVLDVLLIR